MESGESGRIQRFLRPPRFVKLGEFRLLERNNRVYRTELQMEKQGDERRRGRLRPRLLEDVQDGRAFSEMASSESRRSERRCLGGQSSLWSAAPAEKKKKNYILKGTY